MNDRTHKQLVNCIWDICNLLRGPYKRNEYRKVILPMLVLRRFDCLLSPTKDEILKAYEKCKAKPISIRDTVLKKISKFEFYNTSRFTFETLLDDPANLAPNLMDYIKNYSENVNTIMGKFDFEAQINRMHEKDKLFEVIKRFTQLDLSSEDIDTMQMGYVFEESIRISAEYSNEEAGEHFTPREVIRLMVNLLLTYEKDLEVSGIVKRIYDPACGTGGMLLVTHNYIRDLNPKADPYIFGQEVNDDSWAVCASNLLISGRSMSAVKLGDTLTNDKTMENPDRTFHYMLANPPFGVEWKAQRDKLVHEHEVMGDKGRFGAGLPSVKDGSLLFLQHMLSKMRSKESGGSRIAIVFNASPLFSGDAGTGPSNIRQWIIENDWLETIVALPDQMFYNTGIATYIWILTNNKINHRRGKVQLINARKMCLRLPRGIGNKRNKLGDPSENSNEPDHIGKIKQIYENFKDGERSKFSEKNPSTKIVVDRKLIVSRVLNNAAFGYHKITLEHAKKSSRSRKNQNDSESRYTELVALNESMDAFMKSQILPYDPDACINHAKTKKGYKIDFDTYFFEPHPPRDIGVIDTDIEQLMQELNAWATKSKKTNKQKRVP